MDLGLWTTDHRPSTLDFGLWTTDYGLRTTDYGPSTIDHRPWTLDFGLWTKDYGLKTTDYGLSTNTYLRNMIRFLYLIALLLFSACQSPSNPDTRNPKPDTRNPKPDTRNPKPDTRNPKPYTRNPKPVTRHPKPETLLKYPSASAGCLVNNEWWIIGDDAAEMLIYNPQKMEPIKYLRLPFSGKLHEGELHAQRMHKKTKHDIEALSVWIDPQGGEHILAFGSGSKIPHRDSGLYFMNGKMTVINWGPLYKFLRTHSGLTEDDWNIEGACHDPNGDLCLFNRKPSVLFKIQAKDWFKYLEIGSLPYAQNVVFKKIKLPKFKGERTGFSGADFDVKNKRIVFCSSAEITDNSYRDGEILGSFVGELEWPSLEKINVLLEIPNLKVESVAINANNSKEILGLVDNDKGGSQLLKLKIN